MRLLPNLLAEDGQRWSRRRLACKTLHHPRLLPHSSLQSATCRCVGVLMCQCAHVLLATRDVCQGGQVKKRCYMYNVLIGCITSVCNTKMIKNLVYTIEEVHALLIRRGAHITGLKKGIHSIQYWNTIRENVNFAECWLVR